MIKDRRSKEEKNQYRNETKYLKRKWLRVTKGGLLILGFVRKMK